MSTPVLVMPPNKLRVAVMGKRKSGKSYLLHQLESHYIQTNGSSTNRRTISLRNLYDKNDQLSNLFTKLLTNYKNFDAVFVDDVKYSWECDILKNFNFTIVYVHTPWILRFQRLHTPDYTEHELLQHVNWMVSKPELKEMERINAMKKYYQMVEYVETENMQDFVRRVIAL